MRVYFNFTNYAKGSRDIFRFQKHKFCYKTTYDFEVLGYEISLEVFK